MAPTQTKRKKIPTPAKKATKVSSPIKKTTDHKETEKKRPPRLITVDRLQHKPAIKAFLKRLDMGTVSAETKEQLDQCYDELLEGLVQTVVDISGAKKTIQVPHALVGAYQFVTAKAKDPRAVYKLFDKEMPVFLDTYASVYN
jgi:hypothetical protein